MLLHQHHYFFRTHQRGSIKQAPLTNLSDYTLLQHGLGDSLKDIHVFTKEKQKGTNACAVNNGGCQELCLFNGTHPVCACAHGKITSKDGKTCEGREPSIIFNFYSSSNVNTFTRL
jgi:low-density lipoprotein receptor-related protein 1 (alpha-2-macroglobulin receptor)